MPLLANPTDPVPAIDVAAADAAAALAEPQQEGSTTGFSWIPASYY